MIKIGICAPVEKISEVGAMGFDYIEPNASNLSALSDEEFTRVKSAVESSTIKCECFNVLFPGNIPLVGADSDPAQIESYLERTCARLERVGCRVIVFGSGRARRRPDGVSFAQAYRQLVGVTRIIGRVAAKYGLTVAIEPLHREETNMICSVAEGAILEADVDMKNVGLLADAYHMLMENESMENISRVGSLVHVHIAEKEGRAYPLHEDENFRELFAQLKMINYGGRVSIEGRTDDFAHDAPAALRVLRGLAKA
jgi:D-psicose/D-tagatose/L-ribulose 3-epimerase